MMRNSGMRGYIAQRDADRYAKAAHEGRPLHSFIAPIQVVL